MCFVAAVSAEAAAAAWPHIAIVANAERPKGAAIRQHTASTLRKRNMVSGMLTNFSLSQLPNPRKLPHSSVKAPSRGCERDFYTRLVKDHPPRRQMRNGDLSRALLSMFLFFSSGLDSVLRLPLVLLCACGHRIFAWWCDVQRLRQPHPL